MPTSVINSVDLSAINALVPQTSPQPKGGAALTDDSASSQAAATNSQANISNMATLIPAPNILRKYASYNPVISWLVTSPAKFNKMVDMPTPAQKFVEADWDIICKSGGVGPKKAQGFLGGTTQYFSRDMYLESANMTTLVGMSKENRGSNATDIEFTVIEPYGMDLIEQLYDYCNDALKEFNYCQIPYMLKIEFRGFLDNGTSEIIPTATKYIPITLCTMDIKVNNLGATYKISALAYNELANTETYGRLPSDIQLGTADAFLKELTNSSGIDVSAQIVSELYAGQDASMKLITDALANVLNRIQTSLVNDGKISVPDTYTINYLTGDSTLSAAKYVQLSNLIPPTAKDTYMQNNKSSDLYQTAKYMNQFIGNPQTGVTPAGVTYGDGIITLDPGSNLIDCLNTLFINSGYIIDQIKQYNDTVTAFNLAAANTQSGQPLPENAQTALNKLQSTTLNWFQIIPTVTLGPYDPIRRLYSRHIAYTVQPYKVYNSRSINAPNNDPTNDNRIVKIYDYIFTGKNTEIITFDLNFNNAFLTYAQFNQDTKGQGTGTARPANQTPGANPTAPTPRLQTKSSAIGAGQYTQWVSSSPNSSIGIGAQTPERVQASDVAATIYAPAEQLQLNLNIYGDPDYIRQDGLFIPTSNSDAYVTATANNNIQGILYNSGEIYTIVNFKIPQDINSTGLLDLNFTEGNITDLKRNVFSGLFRVTSVTNKFDRGLFTQELNMYRYDYSHDMSTTTSNAQEMQNTSAPTTASATPSNGTIPVSPSTNAGLDQPILSNPTSLLTSVVPMAMVNLLSNTSLIP